MHKTFSVGEIDNGEVIYEVDGQTARLQPGSLALINPEIPKNAIFYMSLFTVMVSSETNLLVRALYGLWVTGMVLAWDLGVAGLLGNKKIKRWLSSWIFGLEKMSGVMLALFGVLLAFQ